MVTPEDIADTLADRPTPARDSPEWRAWSLWIGYATRAIERRAERLNMTLADLNTFDVDMVVREAVAAKVKQPDAVRRTDVAIDDGRIGKEYTSASGQVDILDTWWDLLFPGVARGASSTRPGFEPDCGPLWPGPVA